MSSNGEDRDIAACPESRAPELRERWRFLHVGNQITKEFLLSLKSFRYVDYVDAFIYNIMRHYNIMTPCYIAKGGRKNTQNFCDAILSF